MMPYRMLDACSMHGRAGEPFEQSTCRKIVGTAGLTWQLCALGIGTDWRGLGNTKLKETQKVTH